MEFLLILAAVPVAVYLLDRILYRGELTEAVLETLHLVRAPPPATRKVRRMRLLK